jgi:hypothetical protein
LPGYVWRVAKPDDLVCVSPEERERVAQDNAHAAERVDPDCAAGTKTCQYGPSQCLSGYVWRDAWDGDAVCVTPDRRDQAHDDNAQAAARIDPACATAAQPQALANLAATPGSGGPGTPGATPVVASTEPMATAEVGPAPAQATQTATFPATEGATAPATEAATEPATMPPTEAPTATSAP